MKYNSTRNKNTVVTAAQAISQGISEEGGLFVPQELPKYSADELLALSKLDYKGRAKKILADFLSDFTAEEISESVDAAYAAEKFGGDNPAPISYLHNPLTRLADGIPVTIETKAENGFRLTAEELESKITPKSKLLILPFPNNPTGAVMRKEHLEEIAKVVRKHNLFVLSDEIYGELTYGDTPHISIASLEGMAERTIVISGFSKSYAMTGWRLGYALGPKEIIEQMTKLHQFAIMSAPTTAQYAAIEGLRHGDGDIEYMRNEYNIRRRLIVDGFTRMGLTCFEPEGAFYIFPSIKSTGLTSEEFCTKLIKSRRVAVIPGTAFGDCGEGYIRVSYSYSLGHIMEALNRIEMFINDPDAPAMDS